MRTTRAITLLTAGFAICACATTAGSGGTSRATYDDCFFAATLHDWRPLDDENLVLFANGRRPYHVELAMPAFGLTYDVRIGVYDRDGRICPYGGDSIVVNGIIRERIPIRSMRRLTDEQLDALYVQFGIETPAVIEVTEVESEESPEK